MEIFITPRKLLKDHAVYARILYDSPDTITAFYFGDDLADIEDWRYVPASEGKKIWHLSSPKSIKAFNTKTYIRFTRESHPELFV